eukprot:3310715-Prymnesium_polylepis.1
MRASEPRGDELRPPQSRAYQSRIRPAAQARQPAGISARPTWLDTLGQCSVGVSSEMSTGELFMVSAQEKEWAEQLMRRCARSATWYAGGAQ